MESGWAGKRWPAHGGRKCYLGSSLMMGGREPSDYLGEECSRQGSQ